MSRTPADLRRDDGIALIATTLIVVVMFGLLALLLQTARHADTASQRDSNSEVALVVAEAGVQDAMARIRRGHTTSDTDCSPTGFPPSPLFTFCGTTPEGSYKGTVHRSPGMYRIEVLGESGCSFELEVSCPSRTPDAGSTQQLVGKRRVKVTLEPPRSFSFALFSNTWAELKNLANLEGDVWANTYVRMEQNDVIHGNVTAATSWLLMDNNSEVHGDVWVGGSTDDPSNPFAISMGMNTLITGFAKASCPAGCGEAQQNYNITATSSSTIQGDVTTWGTVVGSPAVEGTTSEYTPSARAVVRPLPPFVWNPANYASVQTFDTVAEFNTYKAANATNLSGTFKVFDPSPSQTNRIDLNGVVITGDFTLYTNAPIFTNGVEDGGSAEKRVVLISEYVPQAGKQCDVNKTDTECAVHLKNNFDPSCLAVVLVYAKYGPVAVKNDSSLCGAIYAEQILVKNQQNLQWDPRIERMVGFGPATYEVSRWEEAAP